MLSALGGTQSMARELGIREAQARTVLGQIFGSRDVSRTVAPDAATPSGLDPALLKKMLPMLADARRRHRGNAGRPPRRNDRRLSQTAGIGGLASILDLDRDGNPLDDIIGMAGRYLR